MDMEMFSSRRQSTERLHGEQRPSISFQTLCSNRLSAYIVNMASSHVKKGSIRYMPEPTSSWSVASNQMGARERCAYSLLTRRSRGTLRRQAGFTPLSYHVNFPRTSAFRFVELQQ